MVKLVLLRHGESIWNKENRFTGWTDVDLSAKGVKEASDAGRTLKENGFSFDIAYTSYLKRAIRTLWLALAEMDLMWIPVKNSWRLNERHYGALQGLNKSETAKKYSEQQVLIWRRSFDVRPPELKKTDKRFPGNDPRYAGLKDSDLPTAECLKDTVRRVLPYWKDEILPKIMKGKRILISAHGNSLRALVKHIDGVSDTAIAGMNIPTGIPLVYEFKGSRPSRHYYLGDESEIKKQMDLVASQGRSHKGKI